MLPGVVPLDQRTHFPLPRLSIFRLRVQNRSLPFSLLLRPVRRCPGSTFFKPLRLISQFHYSGSLLGAYYLRVLESDYGSVLWSPGEGSSFTPPDSNAGRAAFTPRDITKTLEDIEASQIESPAHTRAICGRVRANSQRGKERKPL